MILNIITEIIAWAIAACMLGSLVYLVAGWVVLLLSPIVILGVLSLSTALKVSGILCGASALINCIRKG